MKKKNAKEKLTEILQSSLPASSHELASAYINSFFQDGLFRFPLPGIKVYNIKHELCDNSQGILLANMDKRSKSQVKNTFKQLSQNTSRKLKENYGPETIYYILAAAINFSYAIKKESQTGFLCEKINEFSSELKQRCSISVKAMDDLLSNAFLTKESKLLLIILKKVHKDMLAQLTEVKVDPGKLTLLLDGFMACSRGIYYQVEPQQWVEEYSSELGKLKLCQEKGRPKKLFLKALQIIIYKLLTGKKPKKVKQYIEWAKSLTATIINESYEYKGTQEIKAKDIDNSLHSS